MGRIPGKPRTNIVSIRISQEEREMLEQMTLQLNKKSISSLMREALLMRLAFFEHI